MARSAPNAGDRGQRRLHAGRPHEGTRSAPHRLPPLVGRLSRRSLDGPELGRAHDQLMPSAGTCMVMGTASTMAAIAETLGFMLPGTATAPAVSSDRARFSEAVGHHAVTMAKTGGPRPSELLTKAALKNASVVYGEFLARQRAVISRHRPRRYRLRPEELVRRPRVPRLSIQAAGQNFGFHAAGAAGTVAAAQRSSRSLSQLVNGETIGMSATLPIYVDDKVIRRSTIRGERRGIAILSGISRRRAPRSDPAATRTCSSPPDPRGFDSLDDLEARIGEPISTSHQNQ